MLEFFPHEKPRDEQLGLIKKIHEAVTEGKNLVVHAPTGLGKTAASLSPTVEYAKKNKKKVFFLTSRHSQHIIAIETVSKMQGVKCTNLLGKRHMCGQNKAHMLSNTEFPEFCNNLKADKQCEFYENTFTKTMASAKSHQTLQLIKIGSAQEINTIARQSKVCPYEIGLIHAEKSDVIIADYYYIFNPNIREKIFAKLSVQPEDVIVVVDEAHNLPDRIKDLMSNVLTSRMVSRGLNETKKFGLHEANSIIRNVESQVTKLHKKGERLVQKNELMFDIDDILTLERAAKRVRDEQDKSSVGGIAQFMMKWGGSDTGFARIIQRNEEDFKLNYKCLDPGLVTKDFVQTIHSIILMSGTLTPTNMYDELLALQADTASFISPFPEENKLSIVIPKTSTKYERRTPEMFKQIGQEIGKILDNVPGNTAVFFPSYFMKDMIKTKIVCKKTVFDEQQKFSNDEKIDFLKRFKNYHDQGNGAVLLGVMGGNFGEGVDLPGTYLNGVVIIGLPLTRPDLETEELIKYYDAKFGKGWDYGYLYPAFNKTLQSAGRCIRSETDKGIIAFLDERYAWPNYFRCFPDGAKPKISLLYEKMISDFFKA